ncbi:MAG: hypothetical protein M1837_005028 [Sclerophora amabilis]|nr:MAG: hypothetical protein M1837_005028 [Sclerophora amabilis]
MSLLSTRPSPNRSADPLEFHAPVYGPRRARKKFVLCFDGTGNKFQGRDNDSNILKIYRMLDRTVDDQFHYYQPGIGTYTTSQGYSHTSMTARLSSWYQKAKDSAVGTSFDEHVMAGRGAYIARFLAEMLDYVGLLCAGNEELCRFAWKTFAQWQQRLSGTEEEKQQTKDHFRFMKDFRDTFSRPVRRIRFLGLFDTVNSVPQFESAWMQRSKFPYTARSSAKIIRHAVGIDERRAKFRQDLISQPRVSQDGRHKSHHRHPHYRRALSLGLLGNPSDKAAPTATPSASTEKDRREKGAEERRASGRFRQGHHNTRRSRSQRRDDPTRNRSRSRTSCVPSLDPTAPDFDSIFMEREAIQLVHDEEADSDSDSESEDAAQDIAEVWFPGCHADIGGGWCLGPGENYALSHAPLVWMVREASRAGLRFDPDKMMELCCCEDDSSYFKSQHGFRPSNVPEIRVSEGTPTIETAANGNDSRKSKFLQALHEGATRGLMHDSLTFNNGLPKGSVMTWNIMEYLPFRRMDLRPDGSWKPIRWPLPMGEVRDIPQDAWIHNSALARMEADKDYRPGNLIVGGGGRGIRKAPPEHGIGEWDVIREAGDPTGEILKKRATTDEKQE